MKIELNKLAQKINRRLQDKSVEDVKKFCESSPGTLILLQWKLMKNLQKHETSIDINSEIAWILSDKDALEMLLCSGYVQDHKWKEAVDILAQLIKGDSSARDGYKLSLAIAVAITFSSPVKSLAIPEVSIDGVQRYKSFVGWAETGQLFSSFFSLNAWQMRYVVGCWAEDEEMIWARENALEDYKFPGKIGEVTHKMVKYREFNDEGISVHDGASYYNYRPVTLQVMHEVGAVCGGVSKFGAAMAQSFGLPAMPIGQPGHCAFIWWKDGEWVSSNDNSSLDRSTIHGGIQWTWGKNISYILLVDAAQKDSKKYRLSEKMRIASRFCNTHTAVNTLLSASSICPLNYLIWRDVANILKVTQPTESTRVYVRDILSTLDADALYDNKLRNVALYKPVKASNCQKRAQNVVDGTDSEWWTGDEIAWLEIDLQSECTIVSIQIQWWGISVSKSYNVLAEDGLGVFKEVRTTKDEIKSPLDYNEWSEVGGWDTPTRKIRLELKSGCLDPWEMGKYFGIRQVVIMGTENNPVISECKPVRVSECFERSMNLVDGTGSEWWCENNEAWIEIDLQHVSSVDHLKLQWWGISVCSTIKVLTSCDGEIWELKVTEEGASEVSEEYNGWTTLPVEGICSMLRVELADGVLDPWGMNKYIGVRNISAYGKQHSVTDILIKKVNRDLGDHHQVKRHICKLLGNVGCTVVSHMKPCLVSDCSERAQNITDGTESEWWTEHTTAWVEVELGMVCKVHRVEIQWWGTSVSRNYRVLVRRAFDCDFHDVCTTADEEESPEDDDYNGWSVLPGWGDETRQLRFVLENGSLDPWGLNRYFGIRQIIVTGKAWSLVGHH